MTPTAWAYVATLALLAAFAESAIRNAIYRARTRRWDAHLAAVGINNDDMRARYENRSDQ